MPFENDDHNRAKREKYDEIMFFCFQRNILHKKQDAHFNRVIEKHQMWLYTVHNVVATIETRKTWFFIRSRIEIKSVIFIKKKKEEAEQTFEWSWIANKVRKWPRMLVARDGKNAITIITRSSSSLSFYTACVLEARRLFLFRWHWH